jgi:glucose dehydrogenase
MIPERKADSRVRTPSRTPPASPARARARRSLRAIAIAAALACLAACSDRTLSSVDPNAIPPEVRDHADEWPLPGRDYANSRTTHDSTISSSTIDRLEVAWEVPLPGRAAYGNASSTPLIVGDTIYFQDLSSNIRAIDRATGSVRWEKLYNQFVIGPNGVAVGWGRLYAVKGLKDVVALDLATGAELWSTHIVNTETEGIDIQPTVYGGLVFASTVPVSLNGIYTGGDRGVITALDAATGAIVWRFDTVDSADLWGDPSVNSGGGAWYTPSIDTDSGVIFWGVANPAPFPGVPGLPNGVSRPGPNLYTDSVVALDAKSGALRWYHQAIEHDLFDRDLVHTALIDVGKGSGKRRVAIGTGKLGAVLAHDADSGALLWETPVGVHQNDELTALTGPTQVLPGSFGGILTPPSVGDGRVNVAVLNAPSTYLPDQPGYFGSDIGTMPGEIVSIDAASGAIVWDVQVDGDPLGGATAVNDLVLTATFQGKILALDRATGAVVRAIDPPAGINAWPAVAGDMIVWPVGLANPPRLVAYRVKPN